MRLHHKIALITLAMLTAVSTFSGCTTPPAEEDAAGRACRELLHKVPVYYEDFTFWNVKELRGDGDLNELYEEWKDRNVESIYELLGIKIDDIDYFADAGLLEIAKGDFDIESIREHISQYYHRDTRYPDMEVWTSEPSHDPQSRTGGMVLAEGLLVRGTNNHNVEDFISVAKGEELSYYDKNASEIVGMLPNELMLNVHHDRLLEGLVIAGYSIEKESQNALKWENVYKFESPEDVKNADEYFDQIEEGFQRAEEEFGKRGEASYLHSFEINREGKFVEWSLIIDQRYLISLLFHG